MPDPGAMPGEDPQGPDQATVDAVNSAVNQGYSYADVSAYHADNNLPAPPQPSLDAIMSGNTSDAGQWSAPSPTPEENWLQGFGPQPNAPAYDESTQIPSTAGHTGTDFAASQAAADRTAPSITLPGTSDKELSGETAPWEVPETRPGKAGIRNMVHEPNTAAQDI